MARGEAPVRETVDVEMGVLRPDTQGDRKFLDDRVVVAEVPGGVGGAPTFRTAVVARRPVTNALGHHDGELGIANWIPPDRESLQQSSGQLRELGIGVAALGVQANVQVRR